MNKFYCLLVAMLVAYGNAGYAQSYYGRIAVGYAISVAGQTMSGLGDPYNGSVLGRNYHMDGASFSAGVYVNAGVSRMFNDYLGFDIGANIGVMPRKYTLYASNGHNLLQDAYLQQQARFPVFVVPSIVLQSPGKVNVFTRVGPTILIHSQIEQQYRTSSAIEVWKLKSMPALGLSATLGIHYKLSSRLRWELGLNYISASPYVTEQRLESYSVGGVNYDLKKVGGRQYYQYERHVTVTAHFLPSYSLPFSNVACNVGLRFALGKSTRKMTGGA